MKFISLSAASLILAVIPFCHVRAAITADIRPYAGIGYAQQMWNVSAYKSRISGSMPTISLEGGVNIDKYFRIGLGYNGGGNNMMHEGSGADITTSQLALIVMGIIPTNYVNLDVEAGISAGSVRNSIDGASGDSIATSSFILAGVLHFNERSDVQISYKRTDYNSFVLGLNFDRCINEIGIGYRYNF
ncbi:MAG: porin family protein [Rickettsiales bacterium]|jgi:hypothetical protein|nr:porin family protein [Rickettsiales bacterium]